LVAAASRKDRFEDREYFESLRDFAPNYEDCPYCSQASLSKSGILIDSWYSDISPFKDILGLELPYLLVPIRDETNQQLLGLLAADFVGWDKDRGDVAKKHLGRQETCEWIRKGYCKEASRVFRGLRAGSPTISRNAFARLQAALRVGQRIGAASSLDEAIAALREGFAGIAPDCEFCVRRKKGDFLLVEPQLNVPHGLKTKVAIHVDDMKSLAAYVLRTYLRPLWIDDLGAYRQGKGPFAGPKGLSREDVRSAAHLPLRFESTIYGVLSVDSRNPHNWREEGFVDPLINVAERAALILRDLAIQDDRQEAEHMRVQAQVAELKTIAGVADHLPVAVFVKDSSHRFLYVNEQFCRDVGRARQDVIGATDVDLYDEKHGTYYQSTDDEIVKTGRTYENKNEPHPDPEGRKREVHVIKKPFRFSSGSGDGVVGVFWDVTESQQGFRQLQAWRDGFVQSANAIVYAYDLTGEITFANQAAITSLGYGISELVGMSVYDLVLTDDHEALRATILPTLAPSGATTGGLIHEFRVKANDGRVVSWEVATSLCEISPGKEGILAVAHDVTERDHAREQLAHELARTQALRSIASGLGRAAEISALYRLFMLAVTHGECLGFSRAILFLPSENTPRRFVARLAVGTTTLAAARDRWKEAEQVHIEDAVVRCLRSEVNVRTGDLQVMVNGLTIDLDEEPALAHGLCRGEPVIRHLREPSPIRSPQFAAATYSDSGREVESVLAPLREGEGLLAILWADRAFLEDPVIRKGIIQQLEILCTETALTVQALSTRARSEETKVAQDIARGMSYSLLTRAGILEFDLLLLKLKLGDQHTDAIKKMSESIAFFKHAGALATKDWRFTDVGITECMNMDFNHAVREVVERRQDGNITIRLCEHSLPVHMNRTHAEDIVVETLANAMAFCDKDSPRVEVTTRGDGAFAYFEVTDNGKGIHPAMRPDLYKRFKRYPEGRLGMGLAYVKDLVDAYGGSIIEVGRAGSGAHFVVKLPLRQQEVEKNGT
jgi:PAS domain S-box-containing protein